MVGVRAMQHLPDPDNGLAIDLGHILLFFAPNAVQHRHVEYLLNRADQLEAAVWFPIPRHQRNIGVFVDILGRTRTEPGRDGNEVFPFETDPIGDSQVGDARVIDGSHEQIAGPGGQLHGLGEPGQDPGCLPRSLGGVVCILPDGAIPRSPVICPVRVLPRTPTGSA